jgi:Na+/H+-dicarboxylate symporter
VAILCDILKYNISGVVITYNFNFGMWELINLGSSVGAFLLTALCHVFLVITFTYHLFTTLAEYES